MVRTSALTARTITRITRPTERLGRDSAEIARVIEFHQISIKEEEKYLLTISILMFNTVRA